MLRASTPSAVTTPSTPIQPPTLSLAPRLNSPPPLLPPYLQHDPGAPPPPPLRKKVSAPSTASATPASMPQLSTSNSPFVLPLLKIPNSSPSAVAMGVPCYFRLTTATSTLLIPALPKHPHHRRHEAGLMTRSPSIRLGTRW